MLSPSKRSVLAHSRCLASTLRRGLTLRQPQLLLLRDFHSSEIKKAGSRQTWMPMRVKTPWIDALTKRREEAKSGQPSPSPKEKPDLAPKKMSDSYYSAVSITGESCNKYRQNKDRG